MGPQLISLSIFSFLVANVLGVNFPYESIQLKDADVSNQTDLQFGQTSGQVKSNSSCKTFPGDADWPSEQRWAAFNASLGGALIKTVPLGLPCYQGPSYDKAKCNRASVRSGNNTFLIEEPGTVLSSWAQGNTCPVATNITQSATSCRQGGLPVYVVDARNVQQIQLAVNFARNHNIRLTIKNTGHDFLGKSSGAGSLSIWTHHLKQFEFLPEFSNGWYHGKAARVGVGLQSYDVYREMAERNITMVVTITSSVGVFGGSMQGGGHSHLTSYYGTIADQVLSLQVVTADGRFVTADAQTNQDLFYAIRGGGASTFGIVTSAIIKAHDETPYATNAITIDTAITPNITTEAFWEAVRLYHAFVPKLLDARGTASNFINHGFNSTISFTATLWMPKMSAEQLDKFFEPLMQAMRAAGVPIQSPSASYVSNYGQKQYIGYGSVTAGGVGLLASRLFPRKNFEDSTLLNATIQAIKRYSDAGYDFHSLNYGPTEEVAGFPDNAVNPAMRAAGAHATGFDSQPATADLATVTAGWTRFQKYIQGWRDVSPTSGAYMNEASQMEPNWQWAFFGDKYPKLESIKRARDPWGLFYMTTGVGSEYWEVRTPSAIKSQDGKLCRVDNPTSLWKRPNGQTIVKKESNDNENQDHVARNRGYRREPVRHQ